MNNLKSPNTKNTMTVVHGIRVRGLEQAKICGSVKPDDEIPSAFDAHIALKSENTHTKMS